MILKQELIDQIKINLSKTILSKIVLHLNKSAMLGTTWCCIKFETYDDNQDELKSLYNFLNRRGYKVSQKRKKITQGGSWRPDHKEGYEYIWDITICK